MKLSVLFVATLAAVMVCLSQGMPHGNAEAGNNGNGPAKVPPKPRPSEMAVQNKLKAFKYVKKYFMVDRGKTGPETPGQENLETALMHLQKMAGLEETGEVDEPTARAMTWPRCGDTDTVQVEITEEGERKKRYAVTGRQFQWNKFDLTYKIKNYPNASISLITHDEVDEAVANAFKLWSDVTPLTFTRVPPTSSADIVLLFGKGIHTQVNGDPAFDGKGGTLAHAFSPNSGWGSLNGDVHYDDEETFTHKKYFGRNLQYVTAHEVGHSLGLDHSNTQGALMWPFILGYVPNYQLPEDDRLGIQEIYGVNPNPPVEPPVPTTLPPPTTPAPPPSYCNMTFDDVAVIRGEIFAFKGKNFWRFSYDGHLVNPEEGTQIRAFFKKVPSALNAIVERWFDEKIIFVKGKKFWELTETKADQGYPQLLSTLGLPKLLDCAMHRASSGTTYYFKDKLVYEFNEFDGLMSEESPRKVHHVFDGIPRGTQVTAAFTGLDGKHYLLVGTNYYIVEPNLKSDGVLSNFGQDFLRCP